MVEQFVNGIEYKVRIDSVFPRKGGGTIKLAAGTVVTDPYYERFLSTGLIVKVPSAGTSRTEESEPEPSENAPNDSEVTRAKLNAMTKAQLQALAPEFKGNKKELIEHLLAEKAGAENN